LGGLTALVALLVIACGSDATATITPLLPPDDVKQVQLATDTPPPPTPRVKSKEPLSTLASTVEPTGPLLIATTEIEPTNTPPPLTAAREATPVPTLTPAALPEGVAPATPPPSTPVPPVATPSGPVEISMGGAALGGSAETKLLGQQILTDTPAKGVAWVAHEALLAAGDAQEHSHEFAFVYAKDGAHVLRIGTAVDKLNSGNGASIPTGVVHRHEAPDGPSLFWEVRLARSGPEPYSGLPGARLVFVSKVLGDIPDNPLATFVDVLIPTGGRTSVHTHPGPELIYQLSGRIIYENAIIGAREMGPGEVEGIPPKTAVQKRNPFETSAEFLSWFLVDPGEPFASPAQFVGDESKGENIALATKGVRVAGVSSNYGRVGVDSAYGANNALDGDPSTEWSTHGDGDNAWIEIELPGETHVTSLGFWTRTMGTSAEIFSFRVVTDRGEVYGPFTLADASAVHYFDTDLIATRLRFEAVNSSGGNTGAVEIEVYGDPLP